MGGTRSLCSVRTPMLTSPALSAWFSECGIGTKNDSIPSTSTTSPTTNKDLMQASDQPAWHASKADSAAPSYDPTLLANSTRLPTAVPQGPLALLAFLSI